MWRPIFVDAAPASGRVCPSLNFLAKFKVSPDLFTFCMKVLLLFAFDVFFWHTEKHVITLH